MILSKRAALGGVQLDEIHERIVIRGIQTGTPRETIQAVNRMGYAGQRITSRRFEPIEVTVSFAVDVPKREMALRREILDAVKAWALRKGWLTLNYLEGRRLYVDTVAVPDLADPWEWTKDYQITFRAYNVPFWQDETPVSGVTPTAASGGVSLAIGGNVKSVLDADFRNQSGMVINNFSLSAGGNTISLSGLGLGGSETLSISHGTDGLLRITAGGRNVYGRYTGADDLFVQPGNVWAAFSADRAGQLTVRNYGRWI